MTAQHGDWQLDRHARRGGWRRVLLLILVLITAAAGTFLVVPVVSSRGPDWLKIGFLPAFVLLFAWAALSFWAGVFGFALGVLRRHPVTLRRHGPADGAVPELRARTAILMPVYNEDPEEVFERLRVIYGANYQLQLDSVPGEGTCARIVIPEISAPARITA